MTAIRKLLVDVERRFQQAGIESARTDAELLLSHALGIGRSQLMIASELSAEQLHEYELLVRRRVLREPLQYITGSAPFRRIELNVGPGVLVPRPETELIVDIVKRFATPGITLDLGAGSGCIGLSIATELSGFDVYLVENSQLAFDYLTRNISDHVDAIQPNSKVTAINDDLVNLPKLRPDLVGKVNAITANPPYVPIGSAVSAEVQFFEPTEAVFAEDNGYAVIDSIIAVSEMMLAPGGLIVIEHHESHGRDSSNGGVVGRLRVNGGFTDTGTVDDLTNRPRFSYGIRK